MTSSAARPDEDHSVLGRVETECGLAAALALAAAYGGRELYVPRRIEAITESHPLAIALGLACAHKVAAVLGHGRLIVPMGPLATPAKRKRAVRELKLEGRSNSFIARSLGIHIRWVEKLVAAEGLAGDDAQPRLL